MNVHTLFIMYFFALLYFAASDLHVLCMVVIDYGMWNFLETSMLQMIYHCTVVYDNIIQNVADKSITWH